MLRISLLYLASLSNLPHKLAVHLVITIALSSISALFNSRIGAVFTLCYKLITIISYCKGTTYYQKQNIMERVIVNIGNKTYKCQIAKNEEDRRKGL